MVFFVYGRGTPQDLSSIGSNHGSRRQEDIPGVDLFYLSIGTKGNDRERWKLRDLSPWVRIFWGKRELISYKVISANGLLAWLAIHIAQRWLSASYHKFKMKTNRKRQFYSWPLGNIAIILYYCINSLWHRLKFHKIVI